jgi:hypothetical protein
MRFTLGAIFLVRVPETIITSACRGDGLRISEPKREISHGDAKATPISNAQQANPKVNGHIEYLRPQLATQSKAGIKGVFSK